MEGYRAVDNEKVSRSPSERFQWLIDQRDETVLRIALTKVLEIDGEDFLNIHYTTVTKLFEQTRKLSRSHLTKKKFFNKEKMSKQSMKIIQREVEESDTFGQGQLRWVLSSISQTHPLPSFRGTARISCARPRETFALWLRKESLSTSVDPSESSSAMHLDIDGENRIDRWSNSTFSSISTISSLHIHLRCTRSACSRPSRVRSWGSCKGSISTRRLFGKRTSTTMILHGWTGPQERRDEREDLKHPSSRWFRWDQIKEKKTMLGKCYLTVCSTDRIDVESHRSIFGLSCWNSDKNVLLWTTRSQTLFDHTTVDFRWPRLIEDENNWERVHLRWTSVCNKVRSPSKAISESCDNSKWAGLCRWWRDRERSKDPVRRHKWMNTQPRSGKASLSANRIDSNCVRCR